MEASVIGCGRRVVTAAIQTASGIECGRGSDKVLVVVLEMTTQRSGIAVALGASDELALKRLLGAVSHHVPIPVTRHRIITANYTVSQKSSQV